MSEELHDGMATPPHLPLLEYLGDSTPAEWLRTSLTTFGQGVASIIPGHLEAYARVYHPFVTSGSLVRWRDMSAESGIFPSDPAGACEFATYGARRGQARTGDLPPVLIPLFVEHLVSATTTPETCYFAVWEGIGGSIVPQTVAPTLELPHRRYHLFTGPVEGATTSFCKGFARSANLWWPADQAWCVATEVDNAWTYVGGRRSCIQALLDDPRLEAVETSALALW